MLLFFHNHTTSDDLSNFGSLCQNISVVVFKFKGRYLSRRMAYPSNGSFNPFVISNKEAHIVNGNIEELLKSWTRKSIRYVIAPKVFVSTRGRT